MGNALTFLLDNCQEDEFVVYTTNQSTFINTILVPVYSLNPADIDDLMSWDCDPASSWSIDVRVCDPDDLIHAAPALVAKGAAVGAAIPFTAVVKRMLGPAAWRCVGK